MVLSETTAGETTQYWHALDTLAQSDGTTTEYFGYDGLGSVRQLVDTSGSVGLAQTFDAYGNGYATSGNASSRLGWTGEQTDSNGFVYLRARYYAPGMGRFTQMDPSRLERNGYLYSAGNPVMFADPSGLESIETARFRHWYEDLYYGIYRPTPLGAVEHYPMGDCYGDPFCMKYGQVITDRAYILRKLSNITPLPNEDAWKYPWADRWRYGEKNRQYVCADLIRDVYETAGVNIQAMMTSVGITRPSDASRSAEAYNDYLRTIGQFRDGSDFPYYPGEIVILWDSQLYSDYVKGQGSTQCVDDKFCAKLRGDAAGFHAGIVVRGGESPEDVLITQVSYTVGRVEEVSLATYVFERTAPYGYARDILLPQQNYIYDALEKLPDSAWVDPILCGTQTRDQMVASNPKAVLNRFVFHGSPAPKDVIGF